MERDEAIQLINDLVHAEVRVVNQVNSARGVSKKAEAAEKAACAKLYHALTGSLASEQAILEMTNV